MKIKKILLYFFLLIFLIGFIYSSIKIFFYIKDNIQNEKIRDSIDNDVKIVNNADENIKEYKINFQELKNRNSDTIAWLKINGTNIEYVVVKGKDNDYYLNHNFEKQNNSAGWIFADYRNKFDFTDYNTVIYGHNMKNDSMFRYT